MPVSCMCSCDQSQPDAAVSCSKLETYRAWMALMVSCVDVELVSIEQAKRLIPWMLMYDRPLSSKPKVRSLASTRWLAGLSPVGVQR